MVQYARNYVKLGKEAEEFLEKDPMEAKRMKEVVP